MRRNLINLVKCLWQFLYNPRHFINLAINAIHEIISFSLKSDSLWLHLCTSLCAALCALPTNIKQLFKHTISTDYTIYHKCMKEDNISFMANMSNTVNSNQYRWLFCQLKQSFETALKNHSCVHFVSAMRRNISLTLIWQI